MSHQIGSPQTYPYTSESVSNEFCPNLHLHLHFLFCTNLKCKFFRSKVEYPQMWVWPQVPLGGPPPPPPCAPRTPPPTSLGRPLPEPCKKSHGGWGEEGRRGRRGKGFGLREGSSNYNGGWGGPSKHQLGPDPHLQQTRVYPHPLGAGSARPNPKMGAGDPENPLFLGFSVLRGGFRPWSQTMVPERGQTMG